MWLGLISNAMEIYARARALTWLFSTGIEVNVEFFFHLCTLYNMYVSLISPDWTCSALHRVQEMLVYTVYSALR